LETALYRDSHAAANSNETDRLAVLREYLRATQPRDVRDGDGPGNWDADGDDDDGAQQQHLPDIMQTWSHASQVNSDNLMSAVPVVLALLLKLLSQSLDLGPFGIGICRTLVQKRQLELISRNLSADKGKAFIISPTLRMLREAVAFDGGVVAKPLFRARISTFKSLARNMGIVHIGDEAEDDKRPSTRTTAILFFLNALKFLPAEAKKELISQRDVVAALTRDLKLDPAYLVLEMLKTLRDCVLMDDKIPREAKSNLLNTSTLVRLSTLYQYRQNAEAGLPSVSEAAHSFLLTACTNPSCGVLRQDSGFYPRDIDLAAVLPAADLDKFGLESVPWMNKYNAEVPVRNYTLSHFLPNLRPWASVEQSDLITVIFKVAPELVASYFLESKSFTFEPKLSATWIGYAGFLFKTVALPLPENLCRSKSLPQLPPPASIAIDNILPLPLSQKALNRCLASKSNMISFFATRILAVAVEKLGTAVKMYRDESHIHRGVWEGAATRLIGDFCSRAPAVKDMINSYRAVPESNVLHREAASRLLRLCYEVIPQAALMANFDVSQHLEASLERILKQNEEDPRDFAMCMRELENLVAIAGYSPGMRWFSVSENRMLSAFTTFLKVYVDTPNGVSVDGIRRVLDFVATESSLVPKKPKHPGLLPLLEAIQSLRESSSSLADQIWPFLDSCITRCAAAPIKYIEMIQDLIEEVESEESKSVSPLVVVILEQLPFAVTAGNKDVLFALGKLLPRFMGLLVVSGENTALLDAIYIKAAKHFREAEVKLEHKRIPSGLRFQHNIQPLQEKLSTRPARRADAGGEPEESGPAMDDEELQRALNVPDGLAADNSALMKWVSKPVDELLDEGYAMSLIKLLASEHASIRKEALVNILKMAAKIRESEEGEKEQIWLLLSELAETARSGQIETGPLPSPCVAFACHALTVLRNPLSSLYPKVNRFLARGPVWNMDRPPLVHEILQEGPGAGDSYYTQVNWLLTYLIDGLRTPKDLEQFHKRRANGPLLEKVLALTANPYMRIPLRTQVLRLLYRITKIGEGSTILSTRFGVLNWLVMQEHGSAEAKELYKGLRARVWRTSDGEKVAVWSKGGIGVLCQDTRQELQGTAEAA